MINFYICLPQNIEKVKIPNWKVFDRKGEQGVSWKKSVKAAGKADKNTFAVWGFPSFPGLSCDGGFLQALYTSAAKEEVFSLSTVSSGTQILSGLFWYSPEKGWPFFFFSPQDYFKILLCRLTNFNINYVASDLKLLLLKLRDSNKLVHFDFKLSKFYTINVS